MPVLYEPLCCISLPVHVVFSVERINWSGVLFSAGSLKCKMVDVPDVSTRWGRLWNQNVSGDAWPMQFWSTPFQEVVELGFVITDGLIRFHHFFVMVMLKRFPFFSNWKYYMTVIEDSVFDPQISDNGDWDVYLRLLDCRLRVLRSFPNWRSCMFLWFFGIWTFNNANSHLSNSPQIHVRKTQKLVRVHCLSTNPVLALKYLLKCYHLTPSRIS